jgi:hypothetical protein
MSTQITNTFNLKTTIVVIFILFSFRQAQAVDPDSDKTTNVNASKPQELVTHYYNELLKQLNQTNKNTEPIKNFINTQGKIDDKQVSKFIGSFPVKDQQINHTAGLLKGLVYDPNNPGPFFDNLITLQTISLNAQSGLISIGEKTLGPKNSYVLGMRENYDRTAKYLEALKQQKFLLEQARPHK